MPGASSERSTPPANGMGSTDAAAQRNERSGLSNADCRLTYDPPYDWPGVLAFLEKRLLRGAERVADGAYEHTARLGDHVGRIHVSHAASAQAIEVRVTASLWPVLAEVVQRVRHVFDVDARPGVIAAHLARDPLLADAVARAPGLRVPGAFDGFELAVRAILGQQITVRAAATLAGRFVAAFGDPVDTTVPDLTHLAPTPARVAALDPPEIAALGIVRARAASIVALADEVASGRLVLEAGADPEATMTQLVRQPGIGRWTAHYIALRALRWSDAFPREDIVLQKQMGGLTARAAEARSQPWRPWRSYATLHLWRAAGEAAQRRTEARGALR